MQESVQVELKVNGKLPHWLQGTLVRNGPVRMTVNGQTNTHWFDGLAELHAFKMNQQTVTYTSRFLRTDAYRAVTEEKSLHYLGFASDPCRSLFRHVLTFFSHQGHPLHNANINVGKIGEAFAALYEIPLPVRFDLETLETLGVVDYADELPKEHCWESAHPHVGEETVNYVVDYGFNSHYILYKILNGQTARQELARIPVDRPSYMHSFSITERFAIFTEYPFVVSPLKMMIGSKPFIYNYQWQPERGTRFLIVDKKTGEIVDHCVGSAFFSFHHINAFESDEGIVVDAIVYPDASIVMGIADHWLNKTDEDLFTLKVKRFLIGGGKVTEEILSDCILELPRINPDYDGKPYRYAYLADVRQPKDNTDHRPICKLDVVNRKTMEWSEPGCYPGEPIMIPSPEKAGEDDGIVATIVIDERNRSSFLLVLDARTLSELARVKAPSMIAPGLHGRFFSQTDF